MTHTVGTATSTYTVTHTGTTTATKIITDYVPCSSAVGTASGSTYYSTYLTVSYHTATVTATTTEVEVICPATSVPAGTGNSPYSPESTGSNSPYANEHNNGGYGSESSSYGAIPTSSLYGHPSPDYPASTVYGPGSKPTAGTCAPSETTVYSTIVVTKTADADYAPTYGAEHNAPYPYQPGHGNGGSPYYPVGSGTGSVYLPTGTGSAAVPTGSSGYGYSYDYRL